jgi:hypothetical protein
VRIPEFRIDPHRFLQLGDSLQRFISLPVARCFHKASDRLLVDRMLKFTQRDYLARPFLL